MVVKNKSFLYHFCCFVFLILISCKTPDRYANPVKEAPAATVSGLEIPSYEASEDVIFYTGFTSSYNHSTLVPNWVAYELTADEIKEPSLGNRYFIPDSNVKGPQATYYDYKNDDCWDKGHMVPKADLKWSNKAYEESFFFTNVCPQNCTLNNGAWKSLEKKARKMAEKYGRIYIVCGPVFVSNKYGTLGENKVAIPDAFFKALLLPLDGGFESVAFLMANDGNRLSWQEYACSVDQLEELLGRDLFCHMEDDIEKQVESKYNLKFWGLY